MAGSGLGPELESFINEHVHSVEQLECLLLLSRDRATKWTPADVARELRIDATSAERRLEDLVDRELVARSGDEFHYAPRTTELERCVTALSKAYSERRVTVIGLIFAKPNDSIRTFAAAFKLRRDK